MQPAFIQIWIIMDFLFTVCAVPPMLRSSDCSYTVRLKIFSERINIFSGFFMLSQYVTSRDDNRFPLIKFFTLGKEKNNDM